MPLEFLLWSSVYSDFLLLLNPYLAISIFLESSPCHHGLFFPKERIWCTLKTCTVYTFLKEKEIVLKKKKHGSDNFIRFGRKQMTTVAPSAAPRSQEGISEPVLGRGVSLPPQYKVHPIPQDPHQLRQDRQKDDDGGRVAGKLGEEGDDHSDEQHGQHRRHVLQGVQLPANPRRQPGLLRRGGSREHLFTPQPTSSCRPEGWAWAGGCNWSEPRPWQPFTYRLTGARRGK